VNYQPVSDLAQLQLLEGMMHMLLHVVLLAMAAASVILLCLCLSELGLPRRRASEVEARDWKRRESPQPAARRGASLDRFTPIRLWGKAPDLSGGSRSAETTPAHRLGQSERGHGWGGPAEVRR
jgi:hypothetical protein